MWWPFAKSSGAVTGGGERTGIFFPALLWLLAVTFVLLFAGILRFISVRRNLRTALHSPSFAQFHFVCSGEPTRRFARTNVLTGCLLLLATLGMICQVLYYRRTMLEFVGVLQSGVEYAIYYHAHRKALLNKNNSCGIRSGMKQGSAVEFSMLQAFVASI